jgi:DNA-binding LytR/AlgR family response regulator
MQCRCIIVDDEPPAIKVLASYVEWIPQLTLAGTCRNAFEAISALQDQQVDLMFLDIHMPKLIGTELMKTLPNPPSVIFTTAHKDFAIEAFELDAVDYLLKPISFERFLKAVNKYCRLGNVHFPAHPESQGFVYFRANRKVIKVFLKTIHYIESFKDHVVIHREGDEPLRVKQALNNVEKMLPGDSFIRIHRSFLISVDKITAFTKTDVELGRTELPIGRSYVENFRQWVSDRFNLPDGVEERT